MILISRSESRLKQAAAMPARSSRGVRFEKIQAGATGAEVLGVARLGVVAGPALEVGVVQCLFEALGILRVMMGADQGDLIGGPCVWAGRANAAGCLGGR